MRWWWWCLCSPRGRLRWRMEMKLPLVAVRRPTRRATLLGPCSVLGIDHGESRRRGRNHGRDVVSGGGKGRRLWDSSDARPNSGAGDVLTTEYRVIKSCRSGSAERRRGQRLRHGSRVRKQNKRSLSMTTYATRPVSSPIRHWAPSKGVGNLHPCNSSKNPVFHPPFSNNFCSPVLRLFRM